MVNNYFGRFFDRLVAFVTQFPVFSTWFAALFLSTIWTIAWLVVFFATTWFFDLQTNATDLVNIFWLSVAAESVIRWAENTNFVAKLSKPYAENARGDNMDFRLQRASILFLAAAFGMFFFDFYMEKIGLKDQKMLIHGQGGRNGYNYVTAMVFHWWGIISHSGIAMPMLIGTLLRAVIYKRNHDDRSQRVG